MSTKRLEVRNADDFDKNVLISNNSILFASYFIRSEIDQIRCKSFSDVKRN